MTTEKTKKVANSGWRSQICTLRKRHFTRKISPSIISNSLWKAMFSLFNRVRVVDSETAKILQHCFQWALDNFDQNQFYNATVLVQPTREYFPDRATNEADMARALCARILKYTGLAQWPFKLVLPQEYEPKTPPLLNLQPQPRHLEKPPELLAGTTVDTANQYMEVSYSSAMMKKPMDLVGSMSKNIAQHYLFQSQLTPPTGLKSFEACAEILAIFMGFGIMIANSAYTFRGGCGRCYDPRAIRTAALSEDEAVYCLALFCHYKNISSKTVTPALKGYLRSRFKKARKQIKRNLLENEKIGAEAL